jgi:uncharacterized protein
VGWRGFALPRLQQRLDALWAALVLGVIWALWHLPELISDPGQRPPLQFIVWILAQSVILAWLYNSTNGSLPIVIICHAAINTAGRFTLPEFLRRQLPDRVVVHGWALRCDRGDRDTARRRQTANHKRSSPLNR